MQKLHYFLLLFSFLLCQCKEKNPPPETAAVRSSAVVAMLYKDPLVKEWLGAPGKAYFDKVEGGIWLNEQWEVIFQDGFEKQSKFPDVPATLPTVKTADFQEGFWYRMKIHW